MTGLHTGHTPIRGNKEIQPEGQYPLPDSVITLPEFLKTQGYATGGFGKWGARISGIGGAAKQSGIRLFLWLQLPKNWSQLLSVPYVGE